MASPAASISSEPIVAKLLSFVQFAEQSFVQNIAATNRYYAAYLPGFKVGLPNPPTSAGRIAHDPKTKPQFNDIGEIKAEMVILIIKAGLALSSPDPKDEAFLFSCKKEWVRLKHEVRRKDMEAAWLLCNSWTVFNDVVRRRGPIGVRGSKIDNGAEVAYMRRVETNMRRKYGAAAWEAYKKRMTEKVEKSKKRVAEKKKDRVGL